MEEIQITENQHYVPRCYLRNFALNVGKPRKPKYMIGFYRFSEDLLKESVCSVESVCNKDFFYDTDNTVEHMLRDKESNWAWVIRSAINKSQSGSANALTTEEIFFLKEFAIYQYIRTPSNLNYNVLQTAEALFYIFIREHPEYLNSNGSLSAGWLACIAKSRESITPAWFVQNCDDLLKIIDDLKLSLVRNTTQKQFITSDAPIIILNPYTIRHCGLGMIGIVIVYPIDEYTGVIIYDEKMYSMLPGVIELCSEADVDALNAYQFVTAEDFLLSKEDEVLKVIKDDKGLTDKRNHFKEKNKITMSMSDPRSETHDSIFAIHGRNIDYDYKLSFLRLPKVIRKISEDCRDSLPRDYEKGWRIRLLKEAYGMDDIRKQQGFPMKAVVQQRNDFKKLLSFMDDYWGISPKDRVITPEMMKQIKANNGKFYKVNK